MKATLDPQQFLTKYYRLVLNDPAALIGMRDTLSCCREQVEQIEDEWNITEQNLLSEDDLPTDKEDFLKWYTLQEQRMNESIKDFILYLRDRATVEQVAFYICMEEMIDGSFDDLMAMAQLGMPPNCKMTAAENYWDEMGNGDPAQVHTTMFLTSSSYMRRVLSAQKLSIDHAPMECLMNGNLLLMWATRREFNIRLIGAMGLVEGSAPVRFSATTSAMVRLGLPDEVIAYHKAHISIDTRHSGAWYEHVLEHYSGCGRAVIRELALGVAIRYNVALRYYNFMHHAMRGIL
jgi:hypothetical protein